MSDKVFVILFRGINVGGNKIAKMEVLRAALTQAGFGEVATYVQSGNVVLTSAKTAKQVAAEVEALFAKTFGFSSRVTIRSADEWRRLIKSNPFPEAAAAHKTLHAVILDGEPAADAIDRFKAKANETERFEIRDGVLYLHTPDGFGTSKLAAVFDQTLKVPLTARNWRTVLTIMEMVEKAGGPS